MMPSIGFIGLGAMGLPMAKNLLDAGYPLKVWNRSRDKADALTAFGAEVVNSPRETATPGGIVISMVADDLALEAICEGSEGLVGALGPHGIHLSCSTVSPRTLLALEALHQAHGETLLAAPVFGRPDAAAAKKLWILLSGDARQQERVAELLGHLGQGMQALGGSVETAAAMKLAGNFMILSAVEVLGESMLLAERYGVPRATLADFFGRTLFAGPIYQNYGKQIAERRYRPAGFKLPLGLKDMRLVAQAAERVGVPMPVADLLKNRLVESMSKGRSDLDWTAIELSIADAAGEKH